MRVAWWVNSSLPLTTIHLHKCFRASQPGIGKEDYQFLDRVDFGQLNEDGAEVS